jgi:hypothetical protein
MVSVFGGYLKHKKGPKIGFSFPLFSAVSVLTGAAILSQVDFDRKKDVYKVSNFFFFSLDDFR